TAEAYGALNRTESLASDAIRPRLLDSQSWQEFCVNDFEGSVFERHPELAAIKQKLRKLGAQPALMTGSGAAVFGVFKDRAKLDAAAGKFPDCGIHPFTFVTRRQYQSVWRRQLL